MQRHQLDHTQTICTSLQTDNHTNTSSLIFTGRMLFLTPNQHVKALMAKHTNHHVSGKKDPRHFSL